MNNEINRLSCSSRFLKGIRWLENELRFDKEKLEEELRKREEEFEKIPKNNPLDRNYDLENKIDSLKKRLRLGHRCLEVEAFYVLKKVGSKLVEEFISVAKNTTFWEDDDTLSDIWDNRHELWFLKEIGLGENPFFNEQVNALIREQTVTGFIQSNRMSHSGPLRVLVATKPESTALSDAVNYWIENWENFSYEAETTAVGVLALMELDSEKYASIIREVITFLKNSQNENGFWGTWDSDREDWNVDATSYAIWAISRVNGVEDPSVQKGLEWLAKRQREDGSWGNHDHMTAMALIGLLAAGEGPKTPLEFIDFEYVKFRQDLKKQRPIFLHTSPLYQNSFHVKQIYDKIANMLKNAQKEIRIASPFIDMFYEEIINLKQAKPDLIVKIITRPKQEAERVRKKIAENVIDLLNIATKGNVLESKMIHSRIIIIDDEEVLVTSADLTRDQLFDEFNAGISTSDKETVKRAIDFFENMFQLEKKRNTQPIS
jgi:hypothetical protein